MPTFLLLLQIDHMLCSCMCEATYITLRREGGKSQSLSLY